MKGTRAIAAASVALAALLTASGCGIQSTPVHTVGAPISIPTTTTTSSGEAVTAPGKYPYWVYFLQAGNNLIPVKRTSRVPVTAQILADALAGGPGPDDGGQGIFTEINAPGLEISVSVGPVAHEHEFELDRPFSSFATPAQWQLTCTYWYWQRQQPKVAGALRDSVRFVFAGRASAWHDCTDFTTSPATADPGNLFGGVAVKPGVPTMLPAPSSNPTG